MQRWTSWKDTCFSPLISNFLIPRGPHAHTWSDVHISHGHAQQGVGARPPAARPRSGAKSAAVAYRPSASLLLQPVREGSAPLQACMEGFEVAAMRLRSTGNLNIITVEHMKKMKNNAFVGNIGLFDNEFDMAEPEGLEGMKVDNIKPQVDHFDSCWLPGGFSCSFTKQVLAQLDLLVNWRETKAYKKDVYLLPKELDEKVAKRHLPALGAELDVHSQEQADYINGSQTDVLFETLQALVRPAGRQWR